MEGVGKHIGKAFIFIFVVGFMICMVLFCIIDLLFLPDRIKSHEPIEPKIELVIKNNKVDTLYIYEVD